MNLRHVMTQTILARRLALVALLVGSLVAGWPAPAATAGGALPHTGAGQPPPGLSDQAWNGILAQIRPAGAPIVPNQVQKLTAADGVTNDYFGFSTAVSGDMAVVGAWGDNTSQGAAYVFYRNLSAGDAWIQVKKLSGSAAGDYFGWSVAISGDTVVVGAPKHAVGGNSEEGAATVYARNRGGLDAWGLIKTLTVESGGAANDHFGYAVSISGDTIAVGAPDSDGVTNNRGATYIFARNWGGTADGWGQVKKLMGASVENGHFGYSVAIDGGAVAIGAPGDDGGAGYTDRGAAYIFARNQGGADQWRQLARLVAADGVAGDTFGQSVALSGEIAVVGAPNDDTNRGAAYVFGRNRAGADAWGQVKKLTAGDGAADDHFGSSVAATIDGDTVVVGARDADVGTAADQGAAYLFARNQGGSSQWGQLSKLVAAGGAAGDWFGCAVAVSGNTLVVGAYGNHSRTGAAAVFAGSGDWAYRRQLVAGDGAAYEYFGSAVALSGDTLVVGADYAGDGDQGAAYVFARNHGGADAWGQVAKLVAAGGAAYDHFGFAVAIAGDTIVVGAPDRTVDGKYGQGAAYIFARNEDGADAWGQVAEITAVDGAADDQFGQSVTIAGDTAVVGAPGHTVGGMTGRGVAYIFARNQNGADAWGEVTGMLAADGAASDDFGYTVAIAGDTVAVGAPHHDVGGTADRGAAYIFARNKNGIDDWDQVAELNSSGGEEGDQFGASVAMAGDSVVVGAPQRRVGSNDYQGAAYLFARNWGGLDAWNQVTMLTAADGGSGDNFGISVASAGDVVVVGTSDHQVAAGESDQSTALGEYSGPGAVYVFARDWGGVYQWGQAQELSIGSNEEGAQFGDAVAISGNTILGGAPGQVMAGNTDQGAAHVFVPRADVYLPVVVR